MRPIPENTRARSPVGGLPARDEDFEDAEDGISCMVGKRYRMPARKGLGTPRKALPTASLTRSSHNFSDLLPTWNGKSRPVRNQIAAAAFAIAALLQQSHAPAEVPHI